MIEQLLIVCTSLLFLVVGYFFGRQTNEKGIGKKTVEQIKQFPLKTALKTGIIEYANQEDIDYVASGEAKTDEAREKLFQENFKP